MATTLFGTVKLKIIALLQDLVQAQTLGDVVAVQSGMSLASYLEKVPSFPAAFVSSPGINGERYTNRDNEVQLLYEVMVVDKQENLESDDYVENLMHALVQKFADNETLNTEGVMGIEPSTTPADVASTSEGQYLYFSLVLKVRVTINTQ